MKITGSKAIVLSLIHEGVDVVFGYPGGAIMPTYDALYDVKETLRHVLVRHEQGAIHAAEGYARVSQKTGVCIATSGPGATNLITGIADALLDSVPIVCITGQVASPFLGTDAFQEADILSMTAPITKWNCQVTSPNDIAAAIAKAFYIAKEGRPGPVLVDITKDAQAGMVDFSYTPYVEKRKRISFNQKLDLNLFEKAALLINEASRPFMLVGHGVLISGAEKEVQDLAETAGIPMACTLLGLSAVSTTHPLYKGMLGMHGNYGPNLLTNEADLIIAVGMRFDDRVTGCLKNYATSAKIIHIEIDDAEVNKNVKADVPLIGDAKHVLRELLPFIKPHTHPEWVEKFNRCKEIEFQEVIEEEVFPCTGNLKMAEVIHSLSFKNGGRSVIVSDVGQHQMVTARYHAFQEPHSHITSGGLGTMGFALPAAIGAKLGAPDRQVIAIIGDGGFQMNIQELGVIFQERIDLKIIILNNQYLGMVRQWQELFFESRYSCTEMVNPDFVKICEGYGIQAKKLVKREELNQTLDEFLDSKSAYLLEIVVEKEHNVFPMIPSGASVCQVRLK